MIFRAGLLSGRRIALGGEDVSSLTQRLGALGAEPAILTEAARRDDDAAADWVTHAAPLQALVFDARGGFGSGGHERLRATLDEAWICARAVATGALIGPEPSDPEPSDPEPSRPEPGGGRLLFVTPAPDAGPLAQAARAGLESLARTLSVEWARHAITSVAICPGPASAATEVADLTAFLLSAAGGYYSGCRFDLGLAVAS